MRRFPYNKFDGISKFRNISKSEISIPAWVIIDFASVCWTSTACWTKWLVSIFSFMCISNHLSHKFSKDYCIGRPRFVLHQNKFHMEIKSIFTNVLHVKRCFQLHAIKSILKVHFCCVVRFCGFFCFVHSRCYDPSID